MSQRATAYPLPDAIILELPPDALAIIAITSVQRTFGLKLGLARESLLQLDRLLEEHFRIGQYTRQTFPSVIAFALGVYLGQILLQEVEEGRWGSQNENLFSTPLPFLIFSYNEYERQINVVEDFMDYLWSGKGLPPSAYLAHRVADLQQLGFTLTRRT